MNKTERQLISIKKYNEFIRSKEPKDKSASLIAPPGFGKTRTAITLMNKYHLLDNSLSYTIIVPSAPLKTQWENRLKEFCKSNNYVVYTIDYLKNNRAMYECTLLVIDEAHKLLTDLDIQTINRIKFKVRLGLTATPPIGNEKENLFTSLYPQADKISMREALENQWISNFYEINLGFSIESLLESELKAYRNYNEKVLKNFPLLSSNPMEAINIATKILSNKTFRMSFINSRLDKNDPDSHDKWTVNKVIGYARNYITGVQNRKAVLDTCSVKVINTVELVKEQLKKKDKIIVFSESTVFADEVGERTGGFVYHTAKETIIVNGKKVGKLKSNKLALEEFTKCKSGVLVAGRALDEGLDVQDINFCLIASGSRNPLQHEQRRGRSYRINPYNPDQKVIIVNFYIRDTRDESALLDRQRYSKNSIIEAINLTDLRDIIDELQ